MATSSDRTSDENFLKMSADYFMEPSAAMLRRLDSGGSDSGSLNKRGYIALFRDTVFKHVKPLDSLTEQDDAQDVAPDSSPKRLEKSKLIIILVGLPGRGKTYLCNKLMSFLNWCDPGFVLTTFRNRYLPKFECTCS